jgi:hypothetical protein
MNFSFEIEMRDKIQQENILFEVFNEGYVSIVEICSMELAEIEMKSRFLRSYPLKELIIRYLRNFYCE